MVQWRRLARSLVCVVDHTAQAVGGGACCGGLVGTTLHAPQLGGCGGQAGQVRDQRAEIRASRGAEYVEKTYRSPERFPCAGRGRLAAVGLTGGAVEIGGYGSQVPAGLAVHSPSGDPEHVGGHLGDVGGRLRVGFELLSACGGQPDDVGPQGTSFRRIGPPRYAGAAAAVPPAAQRGQRELGTEPAAAIPDRFTVIPGLVRERESIAGDLGRVMATVPVPDQDPSLLEVTEERRVAAGVTSSGRGGLTQEGPS